MAVGRSGSQSGVGRGTSTSVRGTASLGGRRTGRWSLWPSLVVTAGLLATVARVSAELPVGIAARVAGIPLLERTVRRVVAEQLGGRVLSDELRRELESAALQQLIDRQLILAELRRLGQAAGEQELQVARERMLGKLAAEGRTLDQLLRERGLQPSELDDELLWRASWAKFLDRYLTPHNLERYFLQHRREFDGTRLRVAQILWRCPAGEDPGRLLAEAAAVRRRILAGEISFSEAARSYSNSPTASRAGEVGWIERRRPMPESFSAAAFALSEEQLSEPVRSPFGVHLIQCLEVKPGTGSWEDAEPELRAAVAAYLFRWQAGKLRPTARVEYAAGWQPDPQTVRGPPGP